MGTPIITLIASGSVSAFLIGLYRFEDRRGTRTLEALRGMLDRLLLRISDVWDHYVGDVERDIARQVLHYFLHTMLAAALALLRIGEEKVQALLHSNRTFARRVRPEPPPRTTRSVFDDIAEHKASVALTPRQRKKAKEESIGGKL